MSVITRVIKFFRVGVGISNTDLEYAESTSQTTAPTEGWQTTAPKWRKDYYIWSRTHIYYTDGNEKVSTPMCLSVARSIDRIEECYYSSTSSTAVTGGAWVKGKSPAWVSDRYIWTKSIIYFTDGTSTETTPICCTGGQGPQGKPGENGVDGADGKDAINIQFSMPTIIHKKSPFAGTYAVDVRAYKAGVELASSVKVSVPSNYASSVKASVINNDRGKRVIVVIGANIDVNTNLALAVKVENVTYEYTIPVKTIADGEDGKRGETGATLRGPQSWDNCGIGYDFQCGASGEEWKDVVIYNSGYYSCIKSHIKSETNFPGSDEDKNNHYWRLGSPIEMVIAKIILTQYQMVENLGVRSIEMKDKDGNVVFRAKDGDLDCKGGNFENITATGNFKSRNEKTWNEIEMNADKGYLVMRGPTSVNDDNWDLPSSIAEMTDLFKVKFETDSDTLSRIATMDLFGFGGRKRVNIDPEFGLRIYSDEGTDDESHLFLGKDSIDYSDGLGHVYHSNWNSLLKKIL